LRGFGICVIIPPAKSVYMVASGDLGHALIHAGRRDFERKARGRPPGGPNTY
jgi:hypothetical protein